MPGSTDAQNVGRVVSGLGEQDVKPLDHIGHQVVVFHPAVDVDIGVRIDSPREVGDGQLGTASTDRNREHHARIGIEAQKCRGAAAGRGAVGFLGYQSACREGGDPGLNRGA